MLLEKKIVCITGASRGIGRGCAVECAKYGATGLILHYYGDEATTKEIQDLKEEIENLHTHSKVLAVPGDIAHKETSTKVQIIARYVDQYGRPHYSFSDRRGRCEGVWPDRYAFCCALPDGRA